MHKMRTIVIDRCRWVDGRIAGSRVGRDGGHVLWLRAGLEMENGLVLLVVETGSVQIFGEGPSPPLVQPYVTVGGKGCDIGGEVRTAELREGGHMRGTTRTVGVGGEIVVVGHLGLYARGAIRSTVQIA
jgi:hypothetical protein